MSDLLILMSNILASSSSVGDILRDYKAKGFQIAVLEHQGCLDTDVMLSRCILTMEIVRVDHFAVCANGVGCYGYLLSQADEGFPTLRKLQSTQLTESVPPDNGYWEEVDVQGFYKPSAGLIEILMQAISPTRILAVCDSGFDQTTIDNISFNNHSQIYIQASNDWLNGNVIRPWQASSTAAQVVSTSRYFEYVNPAQNAYKFWRITLRPDGLGFETKYGRLGTNGQSKLKVFTTPFACRQAYDDIIRQKLCKGYVES